MPIDPSIALSYKPIQLENPLNAYAQASQIRAADNQNALAQYQISSAKRSDELQNNFLSDIRAAGNNPDAIRAAFVNKGDIAGYNKMMAEQAGLAKTQADTAKIKAELLGGAFVAAHADPSDANLSRIAQSLQAQGIDATQHIAQLTQIPDMAKRQQYIQSIALGTKEGRMALEALQAKAEKVDNGSQIGFVNTNPLAGQVGMNISGSPIIAKMMTPGEKAANALGVAKFGFEKEQADKPQIVTVQNGDVVAVKPREGTGSIVTGPDGQPLNKGEKPLTESQGKATGMALRAQTAHDTLMKLENAGTMTPGYIKRSAEAVPFVGEGLGTLTNWTQSGNQQKVEQAQRDFVNAALRVESGAAISQSEFDNAKKQYFPQPGDSKAVIEQKRKNRETEIASLKIQAGPGSKVIKPAEPDAPALPAGWTVKRLD